MATQDYAASIQGVCIRVTRLDSAGNLLNGPGDSYVTNAFMRVSFTPEYEEGDEITEKAANGAIAVVYKSPDTLKRINMELAIVEPDPELTNLISGGLLLRRNDLAAGGTFANPLSKSVGWAGPAVGDDPAGYGVSIEAWSWAIKDGKKDATNPYFYWVFPYAKLRVSGDRVIENGVMANTFEGYGLGNVNFASGPDGRWEFPTAAERPYSYARAPYAPVGLKGFYTWSYTETGALGNTGENATATAVTNLDSITATLSKATLINNVATLTSSAAHGFTSGNNVTVTGVDPIFSLANVAVSSNTATFNTTVSHGFVTGDSVVVAGVSSTLNNTYTVTATPGGTSFTATTSGVADIAVTNTSGTATRTLFNGTYAITAVPSTTTLTYAKTHANVGGTLITSSAIASNVLTAIVTTAHGLGVGQNVSITGAVPTTFNVTGNVATVINTTAFTISNLSTATATWTSGGTIVVNVPVGAVESMNSITSGTTGYNVPGNVNFDPTVAIDRVIRSNEDPTA